LIRYQSPSWLPEGHSQTVYPSLWAPKPKVRYWRQRLNIPDGDFIDFDFNVDVHQALPSKAFVLLFHGLEGNSASPYALAMMAHLTENAQPGAVMNWRSCSGEPNRLARSYHSGASEDIEHAVRFIAGKLAPNQPLYLVGVSLGGNALLKWLGDGINSTEAVAAAMAISAPHDLEAGAVRLRQGLSKVYTRNFMNTMLAKSREKLTRFDMPYTSKQLALVKDFHQFDEWVTAPVHGFTSAKDYWTRSSCKQFMGSIKRPTLILNALNDPFLPGTSLAKPSEVSQSVTLEYPEHGGHCGFLTGAMPGQMNWLPQRALHFFNHGR
jgi:uncharacterized protein